jgi:hypothetical protein
MSEIGFSRNCFPKENSWTESTSPWIAPARSTVDRRPLLLSGAHRSSASGRSSARELRPRAGKREGGPANSMAGLPRLGSWWKSVSLATETLSRKDDGEGAVRAKREGIGGVGGFTEGGVGFYRAEARPCVFNGRHRRRRLPVIEEGETTSINGGMKRIDAAIFFSSGGGVGVDPGLRCGWKKKVAGWAMRVGWAGREAEALWGRGGKIGRLEKKETGPKGEMGRK